jgi:hypothetical protein
MNKKFNDILPQRHFTLVSLLAAVAVVVSLSTCAIAMTVLGGGTTQPSLQPTIGGILTFGSGPSIRIPQISLLLLTMAAYVAYTRISAAVTERHMVFMGSLTLSLQA